MMLWVKRAGLLLGLVLIYVSVINAPWLAPAQAGSVKLVAHRATAPQLRRGAAVGDCPARAIEPPLHSFIEDTVPSIMHTAMIRAQMVELHVAAAKDGLVLFPDATLDCRTDGHGRVADHTVEELKRLDAGYGYSADGGKTYPLRGLGKGLIPPLDDVLRHYRLGPTMFDLGTAGAETADKLVAALSAAKRDVVIKGDGFRGTPTAMERIRRHFPKAWIWTEQGAAACTGDYLLMGWLGITPDSCRGQTLVIPFDRKWAYAGWPKRLLARMSEVGARVVLTGPRDGEGRPTGLALPEQIGNVPVGFTGYVWVDDIWTIAPALRPEFDRRTAEDWERLEKQLEERRKAIG